MSVPKECKISDGPLDWIGCYFDNWFNELVDFLSELPVKLFDLFLDAIATIIAAIPAPDFMQSYNLSNYIPAEIAYFLVQSNLGTALGIVASGYLFYFLRRLLTLGIW